MRATSAPAHAGAGDSAAGDLVRVQDLAFDYANGTAVIDGLTLGLHDGEFVTILGGSGTGKSTLLRLVGGLLAPTSGVVEVAGTPVTGPRKEIGFVFQDARLLPWKTVLANVLLPTRASGRTTPEQRQRAMDLLAAVGLGAAARRYPTELSGGMAQRVGLARMLMHDPPILLMDEPFAALDALTREGLSEELQSLWMRERKTVLFVTHSIPEAVFLADRVVVLGNRPAQIIASVDVTLPRPRTIEAMASPEFNALALQLRTILGHDFRNHVQLTAP